MPSPRAALVGLCLFVLLATSTRADVLVVDGAALPGHHSSVQAAVDAALSGDTILIDPEWDTTDDVVVIDGKGLSLLVSTQDEQVALAELSVRNLPAGERLTLRGLVVPSPGDVGMTFEDNAGALRLYDLAASGNDGKAATAQAPVARDGALGVHFSNCADVMLRDCGFAGGIGGPILGPSQLETSDGGLGGLVENSKITGYFSIFVGGTGGSVLQALSEAPAGDGGTGLINQGSSLFMYGALARGGTGGDAVLVTAGSGGTGYVQDGAGARLDTYVAPPGGGVPGEATFGDDGEPGVAELILTGPTTELAIDPTWAREIWVTTPVREAEPIEITSIGFDDHVWILLSLETANLVKPGLQGALMLGPPFLTDLVYLGYVPFLAGLFPLGAAPDLPPGVDVVDLQVQAVMQVGGAGFHLADADQIVILDSAY